MRKNLKKNNDKNKKYPRFFVSFIDGVNNLSGGGYIRVDEREHPVQINKNTEKFICSTHHTEQRFEMWCAEGLFREVVEEELALLL